MNAPSLIDLVNAKTTGGVTPLMKAAESGNIASVEYILSIGGNPRIVDNRGRMAYDYARTTLAPTHFNVIRLHEANFE